MEFSGKGLKYLYFDCETVAAGFADPAWVPQRVTCIAWSFGNESKMYSRIRRQGTETMFADFLNAYNSADVVVGHNLLRFDFGVLQADLLRLKAEGSTVGILTPKMAQDTIRLPKAKGFKKGLDDLAVLLGVPIEKLSLNHRQWEEAYQWDRIIEGQAPTRRDWDVIKARCESDVWLLKEVRSRLLELNMLKAPKMWYPNASK